MPTRSVELIKHPMRVRTLEVRGVRKTGPICVNRYVHHRMM